MSDPTNNDSAGVGIDRLMDTLLHDRATRGTGPDEDFLARVEAAIDQQAIQPLGHRTQTARHWYWGAGIAASLAIAAAQTIRHHQAASGSGTAAPLVVATEPQSNRDPVEVKPGVAPVAVEVPDRPVPLPLPQPPPEPVKLRAEERQGGDGRSTAQSPTPGPNHILSGFRAYDAISNQVTFEESVTMEYPGLYLTCDILVAELQSPQLDSATAVNWASSGKIRSAVATGYVVIERSTKEGSVIAKSRNALYDLTTGVITLRDYPVLDDGKNLVRAKEARTTMILLPDGEYRVEGPATYELVTTDNRLSRSRPGGSALAVPGAPADNPIPNTAVDPYGTEYAPDLVAKLKRSQESRIGTGGDESIETNRLVASVNNRPITQSEVRNAAALQVQMLVLQEGHSMSPQVLEQRVKAIEQNALQDLIDRELILESFRKMGATIRPQHVDDAVERFIKERFQGDEKKFVGELKNSGMSLQQFRRFQEESIMVQATRARAVAQVPMAATPAEMEDFWKMNQALSASPESVTMRTLTIWKMVNGDPSTEPSQKALIEEIHGKLRSGADFGTMARAYSVDSGAKDDGLRGTFQKQDLESKLAEAAFNAPVQTVSDVIDLGDFYTILYVEARDNGEATQLSNPNVANEVRRRILEQKRQDTVDRWLAGLRQQANVQIFK